MRLSRKCGLSYEEAPAQRVGVDGRVMKLKALDAGGGDGHREPVQHHLRQLAPVGARADPVARRLRLVGEACETGVRLDVDERLEGGTTSLVA